MDLDEKKVVLVSWISSNFDKSHIRDLTDSVPGAEANIPGRRVLSLAHPCFLFGFQTTHRAFIQLHSNTFIGHHQSCLKQPCIRDGVAGGKLP